MISVLSEDKEIGILGAITRLIINFDSGNSPPKISPWILGAPLISLNKRDGAVVQSNQVSVQGGCEGIVHRTRKMV